MPPVMVTTPTPATLKLLKLIADCMERNPLGKMSGEIVFRAGVNQGGIYGFKFERIENVPVKEIS